MEPSHLIQCVQQTCRGLSTALYWPPGWCGSFSLLTQAISTRPSLHPCPQLSSRHPPCYSPLDPSPTGLLIYSWDGEGGSCWRWPPESRWQVPVNVLRFFMCSLCLSALVLCLFCPICPLPPPGLFLYSGETILRKGSGISRVQETTWQKMFALSLPTWWLCGRVQSTRLELMLLWGLWGIVPSASARAQCRSCIAWNHPDHFFLESVCHHRNLAHPLCLCLLTWWALDGLGDCFESVFDVFFSCVFILGCVFVLGMAGVLIVNVYRAESLAPCLGWRSILRTLPV